jgi:hypothetical protein
MRSRIGHWLRRWADRIDAPKSQAEFFKSDCYSSRPLTRPAAKRVYIVGGGFGGSGGGGGGIAVQPPDDGPYPVTVGR